MIFRDCFSILPENLKNPAFDHMSGLDIDFHCFAACFTWDIKKIPFILNFIFSYDVGRVLEDPAGVK